MMSAAGMRKSAPRIARPSATAPAPMIGTHTRRKRYCRDQRLASARSLAQS
jgi:hypothetical protein